MPPHNTRYDCVYAPAT